MRMVSVVLASFIAGCDESPAEHSDEVVRADECVGATPLADGGSVPPLEYRAVVIDDSAHFDGDCTASPGAPGADINAVELASSTGHVIATFESVRYQPGTACQIDDAHGDPDEAAGGPGGASLQDGFVSLGGGRIVGEFGLDSIALREGHEITVYEIDDSYCAGVASCVGSERYDVFLTEHLGCLGPCSGCALVRLTGLDGAFGSETVPVLTL